MKYVSIITPILSSIIVGVTVYASMPSYTPEQVAEKENKQAIESCIRKIDTSKSTSRELLQATKACSDLEMIKVSNPNIVNATGGIAPVPL